MIYATVRARLSRFVPVDSFPFHSRSRSCGRFVRPSTARPAAQGAATTSAASCRPPPSAASEIFQSSHFSIAWRSAKSVVDLRCRGGAVTELRESPSRKQPCDEALTTGIVIDPPSVTLLADANQRVVLRNSAERPFFVGRSDQGSGTNEFTPAKCRARCADRR
jgi:hypothetical protein